MTDIDSTEGPAPPPEPAEPRFVRDSRYRVAGGVAAGLAGATGIHVAVIRIAFVAATPLNGIGVLAYVAAWLAMPSLDDVRSGREAPWRVQRNVLAGAIGALAVFLLVEPFSPSPLFWLPVLLVGLGVALWQPSPRIRFPFRATPAAQGSPALATPAPPEPAPPEWAEPAEPPSYLGRLCIAVAVLALGVTLVLSRTGRIELTASEASALVLCVIGAGLVAGAFVGRARWGALPALILIPLTLGLSTFDRMGVDPFAAPGDQANDVQTLAQLAPAYRSGAGGVNLYLSALDLKGQDRTVDVNAAVGSIYVLVPRNMAVVADAQVGVGWLDVLGIETGGGIAERRVVDSNGRPGHGILHLRLRDGVGSIHVVQAGS